MSVVLAGCQNSSARNDASLLNDAMVTLLTSQGRAICIDSALHGEPLAVYRSMLRAPAAARRPLFWRMPVPLEGGRNLTGRELVDDEFRADQTVLPERDNGGAALPVPAQLQLNALAREASLMTSGSGAGVTDTPKAPLAKARWWLRNRLDSNCVTPYTFSKPVMLHDMAFMSVTSGHRGSTYAFRRVTGGWNPVAKWATWLY